MFCLNTLLQVTTRSSAVSNSLTFFSTDLSERCSFLIPEQNFPTAVKHFWIYWVMTDDVLFGWGHTGCNQVNSCNQIWRHCLTNEQCLPSCKSNLQVLRVNATMLSLPIQVLVHAGCSCQCQGRGLAGCHPQLVGSWRCHQRWVQVPIIDIFLSLEWWSMSCWSLKDKCKSQSSINFWKLSSVQWVADFSWPSSSSIHRHFLESWVVFNELLISQRWVQVPIIDIFLSLQQLSMSC